MTCQSWFCCECGHGPMLVSNNLLCVDCGRQRCTMCSVDEVWVEKHSSVDEENYFAVEQLREKKDSERRRVVAPVPERKDNTGTQSTNADARHISPPQEQGMIKRAASRQDHLQNYNASRTPSPNTPVPASATQHEQATKEHRLSYEVLGSSTKDELDLVVATEGFERATKRSRFTSEDAESPVKHESSTSLASLPSLDKNSPGTMAESEASDIEQSGKAQLDLKSPGFVTSPSIMLSRWLDSQKDDPNYTILVKACEKILQNQPVDGDDTSPVASTPFNFPRKSQSTKAGSKRKASDMDASNGSSGGLLNEAETHSTEIKNPKYACHFYKMNQHLYAHCKSPGYSTISSLGEHLRKQHGLKEHSCQVCWRPFGNAEALAAHNRDTRAMSCRETKGTPPCRLAITRKHMKDKKHMKDNNAKWFWIWDQLFPEFEKPDSPYLLENFDEVDQYNMVLNQSLSTLFEQAEREHMGRDQLVEAVRHTLARHHDNWSTNPPWPAPIPTPAATHGSSISEEQARLGVDHSVDALQNEVQVRPSVPYGRDLDTPSSLSGAVPGNTRVDTRPQQPVDATNHPSVDDNAVDETSLVSSRVNEGTEDNGEWLNFDASDPETEMDQSYRDFLLTFSGVDYDVSSLPEWSPPQN